jgi:glucokinase
VNHALALDIGGSHVTAARVNLTEGTLLEGSLVHRAVAHTAAAPELIAAWSGAALEAAGETPVSGIGVAMPGPFDYRSGVSRMAHKFAALEGQNVGDRLRAAWQATPLEGAPVGFENDGALFALGEAWAGAGRGARRVVGITLGTGFGSGFVADGTVCTGGDAPPDGAVWNLPFRGGIAEDFVSGAAISRDYQVRTGRNSGAEQVAEAARRGDAEAQATFEDFGATLAAALGAVLERFHAERLVVGGNVARSFDLFSASLERHLRGVEVRRSQHFERAALLGAARLMAEDAHDQP